MKISRKFQIQTLLFFYNGKAQRPEQYDLHLSDAFMLEDKSGNFEWTAHVININEKQNFSLQKKCKPLYDYIRFVSRINHNKAEKNMPVETAVREAVDWGISQNLLEGYIREQKEEIIGMLLEEYDEEACIRTWQEDGFIKGEQQMAVKNSLTLIREFNVAPEIADKKMCAPLDLVLAELEKSKVVVTN